MDADRGSTDRSKTEGPAHGVFGSCLSHIYALGLAQRSEPLSAFEGRCRVTTIDPKVRDRRFRPWQRVVLPARLRPFDPGLGPGTCTFVLLFDNGYFSEFGTFSITDWLGHTPPEVLAKTFDLPAETFADFPKKQVYIATGAPRATPEASAGFARQPAAHPSLSAA